jgi:hypothetical protein
MDVNIIGCIGRLDTINNFDYWLDGADNNILVLEDSDTEEKWYIQTKNITEWSVDVIDGVDIILDNGIEFEIYES